MIIAHRFEDFKRTWQFQNIANQPVALTDATCVLMVLDGYDTMNIIFTCSSDDYIDVDNATGKFSCFVPAMNFDLPAGDYVFFCRAQYMDGEDVKTVVLEDNHFYVRHLPEPANLVPAPDQGVQDV